MKQMKCLCVLVAGAFFAGACEAQPAGFLDGILVVVNDSVITYLRVEDQIAPQLVTLQKVYANDPTNFYAKAKQLQEDQVESLERSKLVLDEFAKGEYSTNWVDDAVKEALNQDLKERYNGSQTTLIKTLQAEGRTKENYLKELREHVIVEALAHLHSSGKVIISPAAIEKYYSEHQSDFKVEDQVRLRMISVQQPPGSPAGTARQIAAEIIRRIDSGVPFADMAKEVSTGPERASGGDCGWVDRKSYRKELTDIAFSLKPGQHGPVVELPDDRTGSAICYVLMVEDVHPAHISPLTEVQSSIERTLQAQRANILQNQWIDRLKAKSHIETF
jgi:parvulin-like peptidyl-prolyl isomerase